jgi:hypothetical protein
MRAGVTDLFREKGFLIVSDRSMTQVLQFPQFCLVERRADAELATAQLPQGCPFVSSGREIFICHSWIEPGCNHTGREDTGLICILADRQFLS